MTAIMELAQSLHARIFGYSGTRSGRLDEALKRDKQSRAEISSGHEIQSFGDTQMKKLIKARDYLDKVIEAE